MQEAYINPKYPAVNYLRKRAKKRIPRFAFEYLDGGCNNEINLAKNTSDIRKTELIPNYLDNYKGHTLETEVFGVKYSAPFGIAPIGLQGMIWPRATEILARTSFENNMPFVLSTVATADIETVAKITEEKAWFQLYNPKESSLRNQLLKRAEDSGYKVLVLLSDVPTFGYRPKEIKNGLSIPPRMTLGNISQMISHPRWSLSQLGAGMPTFKTMKPYMDKKMNLKHLGVFMNNTFSGRLNSDIIKEIRDIWKGKIVLKGVASVKDMRKAIEIGMDGVIISNHGGRQLDNGQSTISTLKMLVDEFKGKIKIMIDGGMRSGPDIAAMLACGAEFTFLGRAFMYGVGALGNDGGQQVYNILFKELTQVMEQVGCKDHKDLHYHLISDK